MRCLQGGATRLAIFYDAAAGPTGYRIADEIAAKAWDAGATVRVRRLCDEVAADQGPTTDRPQGIDEEIELSPASVTDLEWANVMLVVSSSR